MIGFKISSIHPQLSNFPPVLYFPSCKRPTSLEWVAFSFIRHIWSTLTPPFNLISLPGPQALWGPAQLDSFLSSSSTCYNFALSLTSTSLPRRLFPSSSQGLDPTHPSSLNSKGTSSLPPLNSRRVCRYLIVDFPSCSKLIVHLAILHGDF